MSLPAVHGPGCLSIRFHEHLSTTRRKANYDAFVHEVAVKLSRALNTINPNDLTARNATDTAKSNNVEGFIKGRWTLFNLSCTVEPTISISFEHLWEIPACLPDRVARRHRYALEAGDNWCCSSAGCWHRCPRQRCARTRSGAQGWTCPVGYRESKERSVARGLVRLSATYLSQTS